MRLLLRRLLLFLPAALAFAALSFILIRFLPGGPFDRERSLPPAIEAALRARYRVDEGLLSQAARYVGELLRGDLGPSMRYRSLDVSEILIEAAPRSLLLGSLAVAFGSLLGALFGILSVAFGRGRKSFTFSLISAAGFALPPFVLAPLLVVVLAYGARLFPAVGFGELRHLVLPVISLSVPPAAVVARLIRTGLQETLAQGFVRTARAKGCSPAVVFMRHALPHALPSTLSYLGPAAASVLTGSFAVETVFAIPGLGAHFVNGVLDRDFTLVNGCALLYFTTLYLLSAITEGLSERIDPRGRKP